jgi:hypothetical protein
MYAVSDGLAPTIRALGLERNLEELRENGYTIIQVGTELTDRIRVAALIAVEGSAPNSSSGQLLLASRRGLGESFGWPWPAPEQSC